MTKSRQKIIITCDVGEGLDNEADIFPLIHSCNIACGYHAGDTDTMYKVARLAKEHQVVIGAHPSFPDREGFGRREMYLAHDDLVKAITDQLRHLKQICNELNANLIHVKAHGALYNMAVKNEGVAHAIIASIKETDENLIIYTPSHGILAKLALDNNITTMYEVFADRNYDDDLNLLSRTHPHAILEDPDEAWTHTRNMIYDKKIKTISGIYQHVNVDVVCVHGDNKKVIPILRQLNDHINHPNNG